MRLKLKFFPSGGHFLKYDMIRQIANMEKKKMSGVIIKNPIVITLNSVWQTVRRTQMVRSI